MKVPPMRSIALIGMVLVCGAGLAPTPFLNLPATRPLVIDNTPVPTQQLPKHEQLMFKFMVVPVMRIPNQIDRMLSGFKNDPLINIPHLVVQMPCTIPDKYFGQDPVHKPP